MDKDTKEFLAQIIANQVVIYKRLCEIENNVKGKTKSTPLHFYIDNLKSESDEVRDIFKSDN
jgi:hypothetical protein